METRNFNKAYNTLPQKVRRKIRNQLVSEVFMVNNSQTFYNKKNGLEPISEWEWEQIRQIFLKYGINAKNGKICQIVE